MLEIAAVLSALFQHLTSGGCYLLTSIHAIHLAHLLPMTPWKWALNLLCHCCCCCGSGHGDNTAVVVVVVAVVAIAFHQCLDMTDRPNIPA